MNILAQFFGIGAMIALIYVYQQSMRKKLIAAKLCADVCWVIHYLLLGGIAGMIPNFIGIFRELVFMNRESKGWADNLVWPILFILCGWGMGIYTFSSAFNILPITASTFVTISLWIENPRLTRLISVPVSIAFLVYDLHIGSGVGIINESLCIFSIITAFIKKR